MANTIQIKRRTSGSGALSALAVGELGVDLTDSNKLYVGSSSGNQLLNPTTSGTLTSTGDFTIDSGDGIILDADGGAISLKDGGTRFGVLENSSSNFVIQNPIDDKDILFKIKDGGTTKTALTLDGSENGNATFTGTITATGGTLTGNLTISGDNATLRLNDSTSGSNFNIFSNNSELRMAQHNATFPGAYLNLTTAGNLGLGVTGASERLEVAGNAIASGYVRSENITYAADQDVAYLIAGTSGWTGATTNWNTYGFQHKIKTSSGGVPRVTIDRAGGEAFSVDNSSNVAVGNELSVGGQATRFTYSGAGVQLRSDGQFYFLANSSGSAQQARFKCIQVSDSYSGTPPTNGVLFGTDTQLYRSAANTLSLGSDDSLKLGDSSKIKLGDSNDLEIFHDGTNGYIDNNTGQLFLNKDGPSNVWLCGGEGGILNADGSEYMVRATNNGSVKLYYDNVIKFETASTGATVTGNLTGSGTLGTSASRWSTVYGAAGDFSGQIKNYGGIFQSRESNNIFGVYTKGGSHQFPSTTAAYYTIAKYEMNTVGYTYDTMTGYFVCAYSTGSTNTDRVRINFTIYFRDNNSLATGQPHVTYDYDIQGDFTFRSDPPFRVSKTLDTNNGAKRYEVQVSVGENYGTGQWLINYTSVSTLNTTTVFDYAAAPNTHISDSRVARIGYKEYEGNLSLGNNLTVGGTLTNGGFYSGGNGFVSLTANNPSIRFYESDTTNTNWDIQVNSGTLKFLTLYDNNTNFSEKLTITNAGTVAVNGNLTVAGSCTFAALSGTTGTFSGNVTSPNLSNKYNLPNTSGSASWIKLGNLSTSQSGRNVFLKIVSASGYNAATTQNTVVDVYFRTSNGSSSQSGNGTDGGSFYGSARSQRHVALGTNTNSPSVIRIVQVSNTSYDFYGSFNTFTGTGSFYEVSTDVNDTWTNSGTTVSEPTTGTLINTYPSSIPHGFTASGTAGKVAIWATDTLLTTDTNLNWDATNDRLGIGVTPSTPLHSSGTIRVGTSPFTDYKASQQYSSTTYEMAIAGSNTHFNVADSSNSAAFRVTPSSKRSYFFIPASESLTDYGGLTIQEPTDSRGLSMGYDHSAGYFWMYARDVGVGSKGINLNNSFYVKSGGGNCGINQTSPDSLLHIEDDYTLTKHLLHLKGGGSSGNYGMLVESANGTDLFKIDTLTYKVTMPSGYPVGIGTASPAEILEVVSDSDPTILIRPVTVDSANSGKISYRENAGGTTGVDLRYDGANNRFSIDTSDVANAFVVKRTDGSVGIGTASPDTNSKLHVEGSVLIDACNAGDEEGIYFRQGFTASTSKYNCSILVKDHNGNFPDGISINGYDGVSICTGNSIRQERFRVDQNGRCGIGCTPSTTLHANKTGVGDNEIAEVLRLSTLNSASPTWGYQDGICIGAEMKKANGTTITKKPIKFRYDGGDMATTFEEGRIGIGTNSPGYLLDLYGTFGASAGAALRLRSSANDDLGIIWEQANGNQWFVGPETSKPNDFEFWSYNGSSWANVLHLNQDGKVGIGTTAPAGLLELEASSPSIILDKSETGGGSLRFYKAGSQVSYIQLDASEEMVYYQPSGKGQVLYAGGSPALKIRYDRNVGIGTTSPSAKLDVRGTRSSDYFNAVRLANTDTGSGANQNRVGLEFWDRTTTLNTAIIGSRGSIGGHWGGMLKVRVNQNNSPQTSESNLTDMLVFDGYNNYSYFPTGNVGIGTASPSASFHLQKASASQPFARFEDTGTNTNPAIGIKNDAQEWLLQTVGARSDNFEVWDQTNGATRLAINTAGNVGIGATSPTEKLTIFASIAGSPATSGTGANGNFAIESTNGNSLYFGSYNGSPYGCWLQVSNYADQSLTYPLILQPNGGRVGIGTASPSYKLDIGGTTPSTSNTIRLAQANGGTAIRVGAGGGSSDVTLIRIDGESNAANHVGATDASEYGFSLKYMGSRSGNANSLSIFADNQTAGSQVEALTVMQDGKIGINTASADANHNLTISNSTNYGIRLTGGNATIQANGNLITNSGNHTYIRPAASYKVIIDSGNGLNVTSGNLAVGTLSPSSKLHVVGDSTVATTKAEMNSKSVMKLHHNNPSTASTNMQFAGVGNGMGFQVTNYNDTANWDIYLNPFGGNVMIGSNATPSAKLHIGSSFNDAANDLGTAALGIKQTGTSAENGIYIERTGERKGYFIGISGVDGLTFRRNFSGTKSDIMSLTRAGDVGINVTSPSAKLHVNGAVSDILAKFVDGSDGVDIATRGSNRQQIDFLGSNTSAINAKGSLRINYDSDNNGTNDSIVFGRNGADESGTADLVINEGSVGIGGVTSPDGTLHVHTDSAGNNTTADIDRDDLVIENSTNVGLTFLSPNTAKQAIAFGDPENSRVGLITYDHANNSLAVRCNNTDNLINITTTGLGVGSSPSAKLHVDGDSYFQGDVGVGMMASSSVRFQVTGTNNTPAKILSTATSCNLITGNSTQSQYTNLQLNTNSGDGQIWKAGGSYTSFGGASSLNIYCSNGKIAFHPSANANKVVINTDGDVDIAERLGVGGAHNNSYQLYVTGTSYFNSGSTQNPATLYTSQSTGGNYLLFNNASGQLGYVGWGSTGNNDLYLVNQGGSNTGSIRLYAGSSTKVLVASDGDTDITGRLGIGGTHSNSYQLYVNGTSYLGGNSVLGGDLFFGSTSGSVITTSSGVLRHLGDNGVKLETYSGGWQERLVIADDGDIDIAQRLGVGGAHSGSYGLYVHGSSYFAGAAEFDGGIKDKDGQLGSSGQVLKSTGSDVDWDTLDWEDLPNVSTLDALP